MINSKDLKKKKTTKLFLNSSTESVLSFICVASYAAEACSILTKDVFAPCYPYLSPIPYFEQCRKDTCKCGQNCFCSALAHYAHHCKRFGIVIDFRRSVPDCGELSLTSSHNNYSLRT